MIKHLGIILLSSSICLYTNYRASVIAKSTEISKEILKLLRSMQRQLYYTGSTKHDIFRNFSGNALKECGFTDALINSTDIKDAVKNHLSILDKREQDMITEFLSDFGKSKSRQSEWDKCKIFADEYEALLKSSLEQRKNKAGLYRKLGIICAVATAVILI